MSVDQPLTLADLQEYRRRMASIGTIYVQSDKQEVVGAVLMNGVNLNPAGESRTIEANHALVFDSNTALALSSDCYLNLSVRSELACEQILLELANNHGIPPTDVKRARLAKDAIKAQAELLTISVMGLSLPGDEPYDVRKHFVDQFMGSFGLPKTLLQSWVAYLKACRKNPLKEESRDES